jgi:uncharacterized protein with HEPN domain
MPSRRPLLRLRDVVENIDLARGFLGTMSAEEFAADKQIVYAVTRALEIVCEAVRRLPSEITARHPAVPWADIRAAGNVYRHQYGDVLESRLWQTVTHQLGPLREAAQAEIDILTKR